MNVGERELSGLEAEYTLDLPGAWEAFGSLGLLNTEIVADGRTPVQLLGGDRLTGQSFPFAAERTLALGLAYVHPEDWNGAFDITHQSESEALLPNVGAAGLRNHERTLVNLRISYDTQRW